MVHQRSGSRETERSHQAIRDVGHVVVVNDMAAEGVAAGGGVRIVEDPDVVGDSSARRELEGFPGRGEGPSPLLAEGAVEPVVVTLAGVDLDAAISGAA